jgi:hypothetical protein
MKNYLKIFAFFTLLFINGCGKDDGDEIIDEPIVENKVTITTDNLELKDAQIGTINVTDYNLNQNNYNAKFGDEDIVLAKINSSKLSFVVPPNIETGTYKLSIDFSSNSLNFKVAKTTLTETPENVIANFAGNYEDDINETIALFTQENTPPGLLAIKDDIDKAILELNSLSENDKIIAAKFIENNTAQLNQLESILAEENLEYEGKTINKKCNSPSCYFAYGVKVLAAVVLVEIGTTAAIVGAVVVGIDAIVSLFRGKNSILMTKVKKVVSEGLRIVYWPQNYLADTTFDFIDNKIVNFKTSNSKSNKIDNKTTISFKIKPTYRTLNAEDANSSDTTVSAFVTAYTKFKAIWNNNFKDSLGSFPNFNNNEEQREAKELSQFNLKISNNSESVTASEITGSAASFNTTFTNKTDIEQDFTVGITFTDGEVSATTSIPFKIGFDEMFLQEVSGNNQNGEKGKTLENPIIVKVFDKDGSVVEGVDVVFNITAGEGSVNNSSTKTDAEGLAKTNWNLGDNFEEQTLGASIKKADGSLASTINFTAKSLVPTAIEIDSGNNQTGEPGERLGETLKVLVKDNLGNLMSDVIVYFNVTEGGGSIKNTDTTVGGFAEATWTLGDNSDAQKVEASIKDVNNNIISSVIFTANSNSFELAGTWNTEYISNQCTRLNSTFFNNRKLVLENTTEFSGDVNIDSFLVSGQNETYVKNNYNFNSATNSLTISIETSLLTSGGDTGVRRFNFEGTYDNNKQEFSGSFTYYQKFDGFPSNLTKNCSGTMTLKK